MTRDDVFERFALLVLAPWSATALRRVRELPKRDRLALVPHLRLWGFGHPANAVHFGLTAGEWFDHRHFEGQAVPETLRHFLYWVPRSTSLREKFAASPKRERLPFVSIMRNAGVPIGEISELLSLTRREVLDEVTRRLH